MKLRIFHRDFCAPNAPPRDGAIQFSKGIGTGCAAIGADVTILCQGAEDKSFRKDGYSVECFREPTKLPFKLADRLKAYVRDELQDSVVLLIGMFVPQHYSLAQVLRQHGVPYVVSPLDPYNPAVFSQRAYLKQPYWRLFERRLLRDATAIQLLDVRQQTYLRELGVETPVFETAVGYPTGQVPDASVLKWTSEGIPRLVYVGRIDPVNKGLDLLIDAVAEVCKVQPVRLHIQGPGYGAEPMKKLVRQVQRLNLEEIVTFVAPDYTRNATDVFCEHDLYCEPSRYTGFGIAAMEAMLAGRPVLISEVQGIAPHLAASKGGIAVPCEVPAIAKGILDLIARRQEWRQLGENGRRYVLENLDWPAVAERALRDLEGVVRTAKSGEALRVAC